MKVFSKVFLKVFFSTLALIFLLLISAHAEDNINTFSIAADPQIHYAKSTAKVGKIYYKKELVTPTINGQQGFLYKEDSKTRTYLFSYLPEQTHTLYVGLGDIKDVLYFKINDIPIEECDVINLKDKIKVTVTTLKYECTFYVIVSSLPIISLDCDIEKLEEGTKGTLTLIDPEYIKRGFAPYCFKSDIEVGYRGNTARRYKDKRNFSVDLIDKEGKDRDYSLLGMRCDNRWILDGMYNDVLRMRNRVSYDLWGDLFTAPYNDKVDGVIQGTFVEVFLNGEYKGVYCFNERLDRKQLKVDKENGIVYRSTLLRVNNGNVAGFEDKKIDPPTDSFEWYNMEIRYPNENITTDTWALYYDLYDLVVNGSNSDFRKKIGDMVDFKNLAQYYVFVNTMGLTDNMAKNMFWACENVEESKKLILFPWDMDAVLGRRYNGARTVVVERYSSPLFKRLMDLNVEGFADLVKKEYASLRRTVLNIPHVMEIIQEHYDYVNRSGAWERESDRHPTFTDIQDKYTLNVDPLSEMHVVEKYLSTHLEWLDEKYGFVK